MDLVDRQGLNKIIKDVSALVSKAGMVAREKRVKTKRDAVQGAQELCVGSIVPILAVSSVTGEGFRYLRTLLNCLSTAGTAESRLQLVGLPVYFTIEELYNVPHVGQVVGGMLAEGQLHEGADVLVGPMKDGSFEKITVGSIRRSRQAVGCVNPGEAASVSLNLPDGVTLRRGMVLSAIDYQPPVCFEFSANLLLLCHTTKYICVGFQATVFIGSVCTTATITHINDADCLRPGKWAVVRMCFAYQPEVIREGSPIILRQGKTKGMGEVLKVFPSSSQ
ncbi:hypothetical protein B9Z55_018932 [Caenorhabditis nigoni]|nr:hypothetical protein B9Z55_018932 [Caenorhabditis nigoni]